MNTGHSIVVADDDVATRKILGRILDAAGYRVIEAEDGVAACEAVRSSLPDVVLLDWSMPKMNGLDVLRELKSNGDTKAIPVVMLTSHAEIEERIVAIEAGAQDFLVKPCDTREVVARIEQHRRWRALVATQSSETAVESAATEMNVLRKAAMHDVLTGAVNRSLLFDRIDQAILSSRRRAEGFGLLFLDIDGFKAVNDSLGHVFGDTVLQAIVSRLQSICRESDTVARIGGDEFVVLAPKLQSITDAGDLAVRLLAAVIVPIENPFGSASVSASIGIAMFPNDGSTCTSMLANADAAMYLAKKGGKNAFRFCGVANLANAFDSKS